MMELFTYRGYTSGSKTVSKDGLAAGTYYLKLYPYYTEKNLIILSPSTYCSCPGKRCRTERNKSPGKNIAVE